MGAAKQCDLVRLLAWRDLFLLKLVGDEGVDRVAEPILPCYFRDRGRSTS